MRFESVVRDEIARRGRVSVAEFMTWALSHPAHGYYTAKLRTGRRGDFATGAQAGGLLALILAEWIVGLWRRLDTPRWTILELGPGDGGLLEGVAARLTALGRADGLSIVAVDASPAARRAVRKRLARFPRVEVAASLEDLEPLAAWDGVVIAHEFFDALPVRRVRVEADGRLSELFVENKESGLSEVDGVGPDDALRAALSDTILPESGIVEVRPAATEVFRSLDRLFHRGAVLAMDYGEPAPALRRPDGTLRAFKRHVLCDDPFAEAGERDITADVDFLALAAMAGRAGWTPSIFASQGAFLSEAGAAVVPAWLEEASGDPEAHQHRAAAWQHLTHPRALGDRFQTLVLGKHLPAEGLPGSAVNRLHRLQRPAEAPCA